MKSILPIMLAAFVLIAVPYGLSAEGAEMKTVPFWWSTDPLTGEKVYTDYFKESSGVQREHNAYLAQSASNQVVSTLSPSILLEAERSNMVEVTTWEMRNITVRESVNDHGPFANPDYNIRELVATTTWIHPPVVEEDVTEDVTLDVTEITEDVTQESVTEVILETVEEVVVVVVDEAPPVRVSSQKGNTHWDVNDAQIEGSNDMTPQEFKDMKKKHAAWKAYDTLSKMYPSVYPAYVHHEEVVEDVAIDTPEIVVPMMESKVIINESPKVVVPVPTITSDKVVVPVPSPVTPSQGVTSSEVVDSPNRVPGIPVIVDINPEDIPSP